jgi:hypothetical protein
MIKDFEAEERYLKGMKKIKNKYKSENKKYYIRLGQMKEKKEENYLNKRNNLLKEYQKKQEDIEKHLYLTRTTREKDRQRQLAIILKKEAEAKEKNILKQKKEEQERQLIQSQIYSKSKKYLIL